MLALHMVSWQTIRLPWRISVSDWLNTKPDAGPCNCMNEMTCQMDGFQTDKE